MRHKRRHRAYLSLVLCLGCSTGSDSHPSAPDVGAKDGAPSPTGTGGATVASGGGTGNGGAVVASGGGSSGGASGAAGANAGGSTSSGGAATGKPLPVQGSKPMPTR